MPKYICLQKEDFMQCRLGFCFLIATLFSLNSCSQGIDIGLTVSASLQHDLVPIEKMKYHSSALTGLFTRLKKTGDNYCRMLRKKQKYNKDEAAKLINPSRLRTYLEPCRFCLRQIVAGCYNYYTMNDKSPDDDFTLVKKLFGREKFDCYSVGLVQPYIMHSILGCKRLTMVDIDWRIHEAHFQFYQMYMNKQINNLPQLQSNLNTLKFDWYAQTSSLKKLKKSEDRHFCEISGQGTMCKKHLLNFKSQFKKLSSINLYLSALHDTEFETSNMTTVIFLSNAIDQWYTSKKQFYQILKNLRSSLKPQQRAILIYHIGNYRYFGLYAATRVQDQMASKKFRKKRFKPLRGLKVETICRDNYRWLYKPTQTVQPTSIYLDYVNERKSKAPLCRRLLEAK